MTFTVEDYNNYSFVGEFGIKEYLLSKMGFFLLTLM